MKNQPSTGQEAFERLSSYVLDQLQAGADRESVKAKLVAGGLRRDTAGEVIERVCERAARALDAERFTGSTILPALLGGIAAAALGGFTWGLIVRFTGYAIGWVAWGIGLLAGFAVLIMAKGRKGVPLQLVAVTSAVLGIAVGKYLTFFYSLRDYVAEEYGVEAVTELSLFSAGVAQFFVDSIGVFVTGFDALWILLAVGTAWGIPKARAMNLAAASVP
ncbi:MAG: hypothetical protein JSU87_05565 [Gemmatimonadota bacterium]|nr:MAG: hypothetical protein JSU87_05565 [Gemmatimonadota bacterium]